MSRACLVESRAQPVSSHPKNDMLEEGQTSLAL